MTARLLSAASILAFAASPALAESFNRIASFPVIANRRGGSVAVGVMQSAVKQLASRV